MTVQVVGAPDQDVDADVYVEVTTAERLLAGERQTSSTFLTVSDADDLVAALTSARATIAGKQA